MGRGPEQFIFGSEVSQAVPGFRSISSGRFLSYLTTDGQSASLSCYQANIYDSKQFFLLSMDIVFSC
jgi:hypothetical protein